MRKFIPIKVTPSRGKLKKWDLFAGEKQVEAHLEYLKKEKFSDEKREALRKNLVVNQYKEDQVNLFLTGRCLAIANKDEATLEKMRQNDPEKAKKGKNSGPIDYFIYELFIGEGESEPLLLNILRDLEILTESNPIHTVITNPCKSPLAANIYFHSGAVYSLQFDNASIKEFQSEKYAQQNYDARKVALKTMLRSCIKELNATERDGALKHMQSIIQATQKCKRQLKNPPETSPLPDTPRTPRPSSAQPVNGTHRNRLRASRELRQEELIKHTAAEQNKKGCLTRPVKLGLATSTAGLGGAGLTLCCTLLKSLAQTGHTHWLALVVVSSLILTGSLLYLGSATLFKPKATATGKFEKNSSHSSDSIFQGI